MAREHNPTQKATSTQRCPHDPGLQRSSAAGAPKSKHVSMTSSKLDAVLTSLAPFQGELSIRCMQALINLLDGARVLRIN
jgi:hypothetical protein